ncbi:Type-1 restriction enzyme EcoKI specificity protein [Pelagimonas phthalicica]|uniref:Type-1 restriction enzyme EcoKI specificity protein n=1 Tax=Pelagimonas phthalicica TaxID=1037362 RepID=A0A238JFR9_9RHOB|nr:restriction endonuclease subunit S [Pelagimonas phthalicica]TDS92436.1 type I restriction enzyme S subunit [Pelagimonas phthalicica]SMX29499.1 Type-1 restriction enzyme EcoKI specificity protein [Pelagimonas phthalicica]
MTEELPEGWSLQSLGEVLNGIVGGGTPSKGVPEYFQGSIPLMTVKDMKVARPTETGFNITQEALDNSSSKMIPADTVVIATRMGLGKVVRPRMDTAINQDLKALFPSAALDKSFLELWLISIASRIEAMGTGTTVKGVRLNQIKDLEIPVAPTNEQQRIVEKIETLFAQLDKGEEAVREVQNLLKRCRESILKSAVTGELTDSERSDWVELKVGELLTDIRYGTAKKCSPEPHGTAVLRIPNVVGGEVDLGKLKYIDLNEREKTKLSLERGDILIVRSNGSANLVARGAVVDERGEGMAFAGYLIRLRVDQDRILPVFLNMSLSSPQTRQVIERQARSTSGVHNINSGEVKSIPVALPPKDQQAEIIEAVNEAFAKIINLEKWCETELKRSAALRQSILKDAFSGRLVPQDPDDEPASALLERIQYSKKLRK